jgi:membrane protein YqaA with SNARE-associated domain
VTTALGSLLFGGLGYGFLSAFLPILNAEAFVVAAAAGAAPLAWWGVLGVSLGQTAGKVAIFVLARKGVHRRFLRARPPRPPGQPSNAWRRRLQAWSTRLMLQLDRTWVGALVVLVSAAVGVPPLAVVAVVAGLRRTPLVPFTAAVLVGRLARFAALAWPVAAIAGGGA